MVTVWKKEAEKVEVQELGYLSVLQQREPTHTFRHDLNTFKAQGTTHTCALLHLSGLVNPLSSTRRDKNPSVLPGEEFWDKVWIRSSFGSDESVSSLKVSCEPPRTRAKKDHFSCCGSLIGPNSLKVPASL